uniref:Secreted protein n=1 Tax=Glossina pallidipes TaxID=7398 RepID=A0A1A9ZSY4_GLOPL
MCLYYYMLLISVVRASTVGAVSTANAFSSIAFAWRPSLSRSKVMPPKISICGFSKNDFALRSSRETTTTPHTTLNSEYHRIYCPTNVDDDAYDEET